MRMSDKNGINLAEWLRKYLLTEIRTTVYQQAGLLCLY
jgi:hypothetical protein